LAIAPAEGFVAVGAGRGARVVPPSILDFSLAGKNPNLDEDPYSEYAEYDRRIKGKTFENPENSSIRKVPTTGVTEQVRTILRYFVDGSPRVFRFSDAYCPADDTTLYWRARLESLS
jgi:hypothetical protein